VSVAKGEVISYAGAETTGDWQDTLLERCLAGEEGAFASLYRLHAEYVYRLCYGLLQHREDSEEVLQDTFEYAFRRLRQYDARRASLRTWLYQIAVSRCRNKRRRRWLPTFSMSAFEHEEPADTHALGPDEHMTLDDRQRQVWDALARLSAKLRETAVLRYYEELSYAEIGQILGISAKTAESRMRLAHKALKELLREDQAETS